MTRQVWIDLAYLVASVLFIYGLKGLAQPKTAARGNLLGAAGMLIAVVATLLREHVLSFGWTFPGLLVGTAAGVVIALWARRESMPGTAALLNGLGGGASFLVAGTFIHLNVQAVAPLAEATRELATVADVGVSADDLLDSLFPLNVAVAIAVAGLFGALTLSGSLVAFARLAKLDLLQKIPAIPHLQLVKAGTGLLCLVLCIALVASPASQWLYWLTVLVALLLGYCVAISFDEADLSVVIALLNTCSGLAAAATGIVLHNNVLIIAGALVGASGLLLARRMCEGINRSLFNVLSGTTGVAPEVAPKEVVTATVRPTADVPKYEWKEPDPIPLADDRHPPGDVE